MPLKYTISRIRTAPTIPISKSIGARLGSGVAKAIEKPSPSDSTLPDRSAPGARRVGGQWYNFIKKKQPPEPAS